MERESDKLKETEKNLREELEPKITNFQDSKQDIASENEIAEFVNPVSWISVILLTISLGGLFLTPSFLFLVFASVFFLTTIGSWGFRFYIKRKRGNLASEFEEIKIKASKLGPTGDNLQGINSSIKEFRDSFDIKKQEETDLYTELEVLNSKIEDKKENLESANTAIDEAREEINKIKGKSGTDSLADHKSKLDRKEELKREIGNNKETLNTLFGSETREPGKEKPVAFLDDTVKEIRKKLKKIHDSEYLESLEQAESEKENRKTALEAISRRMEKATELEEEQEFGKLIDYWGNEIEKLSEFEDKATKIEYNEDKFTELKEKKEEELERKEEELKKKMVPIKEELKEIEEESNRILDLRGEDKLPCDTCVDLEEIKERVKEFRENKERQLENALTVIDIFKQIEEEEKEKIPKILDEVSDYFSEITEGRFEEVRLEPKEMILQIKEREKEGFRDANSLSVGEKDELYFSVRLALAEELLGEEKGFFILDDPFVKLSPEALDRLLEMVKDISKNGWQILYFTAKGEVVEKLSEDIDSNLVQEVPVAGVK